MTKSVRKTTEQFQKELLERFGNYWDYSKIDYKTNKDHVLIVCPIHEESYSRPDKLIRKNSKTPCSLCNQESKKLSKEDFIKRADEVHNNKYDYSLFIYKNMHIEGVINCTKHNIEFKQTPSAHLKGHTGCKYCLRKNLDFLLERAREIHKNKYDYSLVYLNYEDSSSKVRIICPEHGIFEQRLNSHYYGYGCKICNGRYGWSKQEYINFCEQNNKKPYLYVLKCYSDTESFYKVGISTNPLNLRFKSFPYDFEIIKQTKKLSPNICWELEKYLHKIYKNYKYIPLKFFGGYTECFYDIPLVLFRIETYLCQKQLETLL